MEHHVDSASSSKHLELFYLFLAVAYLSVLEACIVICYYSGLMYTVSMNGSTESLICQWHSHYRGLMYAANMIHLSMAVSLLMVYSTGFVITVVQCRQDRHSTGLICQHDSSASGSGLLYAVSMSGLFN